MSTQSRRPLWLVPMTLLLVVAGARAGNLSPPQSAVNAGQPAPTQKKLDHVYGPWIPGRSTTDGISASDPLNAGCNSSRFECIAPVQNGFFSGVLDHETGLVWMRTANSFNTNWNESRRLCAMLTLGAPGNRRGAGFRLPTIEELLSLKDVDQPGNLFLPSSHPFLQVQAAHYWTSTLFPDDTGQALRYNFADGQIDHSGRGGNSWAWCVRGIASSGVY